jgi:hypothetical protein
VIDLRGKRAAHWRAAKVQSREDALVDSLKGVMMSVCDRCHLTEWMPETRPITEPFAQRFDATRRERLETPISDRIEPRAVGTKNP